MEKHLFFYFHRGRNKDFIFLVQTSAYKLDKHFVTIRPPAKCKNPAISEFLVSYSNKLDKNLSYFLISTAREVEKHVFIYVLLSKQSFKLKKTIDIIRP